MFSIRCSIVLSLWFCHLVNAFGIRNSDSKPPEKLFRLTRSMHDLCMKMTTVTEDIIQQFILADVNDIENTDNSLKCYMYCFLHEVEHFDFSDEADRVRVSDLLTDDENAILMSMVDKCEDLEFSKDPDFDACDYAFELEKCWKKSDPEHYYVL